MYSDTRVYFVLCILSLCSAYFSEASSVRSIQNFQGNITRSRRQANCGTSTFTCRSGKCIPKDNQCDGVYNCDDGSDETIENCLHFPCNPRLFKCAYGACISKSLKCDGKKDCKDNSDETCFNVRPDTSAPNTSRCGQGKFQCRSGECIEEDQSCDGKADCSDNSDETVEECSSFSCPSLYRCKYGACVAKNARCNKIQECFDGSDEANCTAVKNSILSGPVTQPTTSPNIFTPPPPSSLDGSCLIPNNPPNGEFKLGSSTSIPGTYAPPFSALVINCENRYKPTTPQRVGNYPICIMGKWSQPPPTCARFCPSIKPTVATKAACTFNGRPLDSCENPIEGTIASLSCERFYEEPGLLRNPTRICKDGSWDYHISECLPVCGVKRPRGVVNVVNGKNVIKLSDYPWQIGIYNPAKELVCEGSILERRVVITAAHCFTFGDTEANIEKYTVAAGKYYSKYDDDRDENAQYVEIDEIHIPQRYKGSMHFFEADLAVLVLKTKLNISHVVQPVCVDWGNNFEYQQLAENKEGILTGWGFTTMGGEQSKQLKELNVPYISYNKCYEEVPKSFRKFLTYDKICAGYYDKGRAVCSGDGGGGLTFPHVDDRYYLRGIVSTSPAMAGQCASNQYGTYTLVSKYIDFINNLVTQNRS